MSRQSDISESRPRLKQQTKLSTSMTQAQFDNGYWYASELKEFAKTIGIPSASRLRKDELEKAIKVFLKAGKFRLAGRLPRSKNRQRNRLRQWHSACQPSLESECECPRRNR